VLLLAACGQNGAEGNPAAPASGPESALSAKLTPSYLKGEWCYSHNVIQNEDNEEMMSYVFSDDGTLLYQNNPNTEVEKPGTYTIENGHLKIMPTLRFFDFTVESIEPDEMVLKMAYGLAVWKRGSCSI
jgi:hypothetical protein